MPVNEQWPNFRRAVRERAFFVLVIQPGGNFDVNFVELENMGWDFY